LSAAAPSAGPSRPLPPVALAALLLFAATLWLDTRHNGFPYFYHPDEPDKVDQLITRKWNFHHPLLMLGTVEMVKCALGAPDREQPLVVLGRWCSACFAAGGVALLALLGYLEQRRGSGWAAFWSVGLLLASQHQVFELAHYFKEDTALFFAVAMALLALRLYDGRPGWRAALFAGAACGLALSAKYLGVVMLAPAAVILGAARRGKRAGGFDLACFAGGFLAVAAAVNFPVFTHLDIFTHSFGRETSLVAHGERGYTGGQVAIFEYLRIFTVNTTAMTWALVVAELIALRRRGGAFGWTLALFPFAWMLLLSCSTKTNDRYFLPATAGFHYLAGLGVTELPGLLPARWPARAAQWLAAALAVLLNVFYFPAGLAAYMAAFTHDDRSEMLAWIRANIPTSAVIACEDRADLPEPRREERLAVQPLLPQRIIEAKYAADLGATPAALVRQGISYLVISESDYGIFFRKAATDHLTPELQRKRAFYTALFTDSQPLWQRPRGTAIYLHPGLRIYRLSNQ